jgi:hypothetical protein
MDAVNLLEPVDELGGRWRVGAKRYAEVGERSSNPREGDADQGQSCQQSHRGETLGFRWGFKVV